MNTIVEFKNVSFRYDQDGPWVLDNVSFKIAENEAVSIIGHNGSGKSTIAKLMNGLLFPQAGEIYIAGKELSEETVWDIRRDVGMVFQNPDNQFVGATVQDDVAFGMENRGIEREEMRKRIVDALQTVRMESYLLTEPHRLSGGQKQRVAIAGVMAVSPKVLILDEATAMLDPQGRNEIMETMANLQRGTEISLIMITHDLHEIIQADRVIVLNKGEIWQVGSPREIMTHSKELQAIGLDIPFATSLAALLQGQEIKFDAIPLTGEELLEALWISR